MRTGTKSVLFGAHQFFIHPLFVAFAWYKLYGFPLDVRLWVAFVVHDLGYIGKFKMDDPDGELHPVLGARIMSALFDWHYLEKTLYYPKKNSRGMRLGNWGHFSLLHSRFLSKQINRQYSRLCVADKLAMALEPRWLYLPRVRASGELFEYMALLGEKYQLAGVDEGDVSIEAQRKWHSITAQYMADWAYAHRDGQVDTVTQVRASA